MTPEAAIYEFLSSFGIPAYADTAVPDGAELPYISYALVVGSLHSGEQVVTANVWYRTDSEAVPNAKVREIAKALPTTVKADDCLVWIKRGSPFSTAADSGEKGVKWRRVLLDVEYLSNY